MNNILDSEDPDFVILSSFPSLKVMDLILIDSIDGDLITGENTFLTNSTKYLDVVVKPLVERGLRWASTYGNHDSQYNLSRPALFAEESKYSLSYTSTTPSISGITNYYLPLYPAKENCDPVAILWFFDSRGGAPFQADPDSASIPNWVTPDIVSWFTAEKEVVRAKWGELPSLAFVHIPPTAFLTVQQTTLPNTGEESKNFPGLNDDVPLAAEGDGTEDVPFMQALANTSGLHSVYSGHDHGDAWCGLWPNVTGVHIGEDAAGVNRNGPFLCFCKHTGYGGYGNWNRGARNLRLRFREEKGLEGMEVESWVRMENGEIVQRVGLNETYGSDVYPMEDGENYIV